MFTSRAEYRLLLRQDNADVRLTPLAHEIGLASEDRLKAVRQKVNSADSIISFFKSTSGSPDVWNSFLESKGSALLTQKIRYSNILSRPNITIADMMPADIELMTAISEYSDEVRMQAEILMKYEGYIEREKENSDKLRRLEDYKVPADFDFSQIGGLGAEAREKLGKFRPATIGQASRISGITPSDVSVLLIHLGR
jgi:tRNA uridine 5-carboxymethylaminomethyl modification enzyme